MSVTAPVRLTHEDGARVGARGWAALAVLMLPVLLVSVDNTVLSFALPGLGVGLYLVVWVLTPWQDGQIPVEKFLARR